MIIGDSSALIALSVMDRLDILEKLFNKVYVPKAVYEEIAKSNKAESKKLKQFLKDKVIEVKSHIVKIGLGKDELESIVLYQELNAKFLLIDDKRAKKFAQLNSINTIGSLGVILLAKESGLINSVKKDLEKLKDKNLYISKELINKVIKLAKESKND
jgi:predicted nucleic acid-binding protein